MAARRGWLRLPSTLLALAMAALLSAGGPQSAAPKSSYIPYEDARPIIQALGEVMPAELRAASPAEISTTWVKWVVRRDAEIRARLVQGDEDSIVNLLLFGTSFTRGPRITLKALAGMQGKPLQNSQGDSAEATALLKAIQSRADDLAQAMAALKDNERLLFARRLIESKGYRLSSPSDRARVKQYLLASLARVMNEHASYAKILESARLLGDASEEFAERSKLFRDRGLSSDTSLPPNFAIEQSLAAMKARGLIAPASVRRVAVVGPGLDFTDKQDGYDFYPQQTIQPFAIIDTLMRLGLAREGDFRLTTLDLSGRINEHLNQARLRAQRQLGYVVQLPGDSGWKPELADYWSRFGDKIGSPQSAAPVPTGIGDIKIRAVRIRPQIVSLVSSEDLNIVLQRLNLTPVESFDLIIATNILVYYDVFEQSLALANIEKMLRPGGFLLSNNALLELPDSQMRSVGYETSVYSDRQGDGDHIVWYQRATR